MTKVSRGSAAGATTIDDQRFSIKLEETFDVETVRNDDKCFFVIRYDFNYFNI